RKKNVAIYSGYYVKRSACRGVVGKLYPIGPIHSCLFNLRWTSSSTPDDFLCDVSRCAIIIWGSAPALSRMKSEAKQVIIQVGERSRDHLLLIKCAYCYC